MEDELGQGVPPANEAVVIPEFDVEAARTELATRGILTYTKDFANTYEFGKHADDPIVSGIEAKAISTRLKKVADDIDNDIFMVTGEPKITPNEKYFDYLKRVAGKLKTERDALRADTPDMEAITNTHKSEVEKLTKAFQSDRFMDILDATVDRFDPPTPEGMTEAEGKAYKEQIKELIRNSGERLTYRFDGRQLIITRDDQDVTDPRTGDPLPLQKVLGDQFKTLIKKPETVATGTGATPKPAPANGRAVPKTEEELHTELEGEGITATDNPLKWGSELRKRATGYGIKLSGRQMSVA